MSQVVDTLLAVAVMVLILFFGMSILQAQTDTSEARSCKDEIVAELENSGYNPAVVNECIRPGKGKRICVIRIAVPEGKRKSNLYIR